ncbi:MAG: hypothetical protein WB811_03525 [Methanoregula sp.]|uniref:hypothetical protein n=3 Tax=Methanoregula sp. TaxID=2052170 RepID=UPI003BAF4427
MDPKEQFLPFFLWDGDENPTTLIENILPLASKFSNAPEKKLKEMISTEVLTVVKRKYANFEFETTFDENGIFHLKRDNYDCLPTLSTGDRIVLWLSLLAGLRKSTKCQLPLILDSPFSHLDILHRTSLIDFLKDTLQGEQVICIGSELEFESVMDILTPITNSHYRLGN